MAEEWIQEFANEIAADSRALHDARDQRAGTPWSFEGAVARTKDFYVARITGYCVCGSITERERDRLLELVDGIGG